VLQIRLVEGELELVRERSANQTMSVSSYSRMLVLAALKKFPKYADLIAAIEGK
jgi:hypothetical protein